MKILLLVDDEPQVLDIVRDFFDGRYEIDTAASGPEALAAFARRRPDAVFLDINMPGMTGMDVLKVLHATDPRVPVVMVTGNGETGIAAECIASGAFAYVPKPFNLAYMDHIAAVATERAVR